MQTTASVLHHLGAEQAAARAMLGVKFLGEGHRAVDVNVRNHWHAADFLIEQLGLGEGIRESGAHTFERWDGKASRWVSRART